MGVHLHRSERTDVLVHGLAAVLARPPADPLAVDLVAVPTAGIERFICQGLARRLGASPEAADGVCANVDFPSPAWIVTRVIAQATGSDPQADPWVPHRAVWPLLAVIDRVAAEPWCAPLAQHLGLGGADGTARQRQDRRFAVATRLARLFASYASQRPSLILDWAADRDEDGAGAPIPDDLTWQPELWRRLRGEIDAPSPAERLDAACRALRADPGVVDLPDRLSVFGPSRLPDDHVRVLAALGAGREVHLWLADASPRVWSDVHRLGTAPLRRRHDHSGEAVRHPLLRSLGRDSRELSRRLGRLTEHGDPPTTDTHHPVEITAPTLLGALQRQIRDDLDPGRQRDTTGAHVLSPEDASIQVHACHGQPRQADVVREVVLGLLQADATLQPRDILIMCPDLMAFAPLLSAAFGESASAGATDTAALRLRIADRTPEQANDVLAAMALVLDLLTGRMGLSEVLELAGRPPVRARFGFDDDTLRRLADLATQAGIRWGLDPAGRSAYQVPVTSGTWTWGVDRLLLGVAMSQDGLAHVGEVLPVDDVQGGDVLALGQLAELVTRLRGIRDAATERRTATQWADILTAAVTDLMETRGDQAWQVPHALGVLRALAVDAGDHADEVPLSLAEVRGRLDDVLEGRPTRMNFRSGGLTVCGLAPMRSVPHRVVCLMGLDDTRFPRATGADGDDVLARDPLLGERDPRSEDRQLLLDAVMAATDHLVVTYTGSDDRSNETRPPCPALAELLDTVDVMATTSSGSPARDQVRLKHPLQPFDARNFITGALVPTGPFSHDRAALAAARRLTGPRSPRPAFLVGDLPPEPVAELALPQLGAFLASPAAAFLRSRIGLAPRPDDDPAPEAIPLEPDGLATWQIGERALGQVARGVPPADVAAAERLRGQLPPGALGSAVLQGIGAEVSALAHRAALLRVRPSRPISARLDLPGGVRLVGTIPDVHDRSIVRLTYSRSKPAQPARVWPELLAAAATTGEAGWSAHLVTRDDEVTLRAPAPDEAARVLAELAELYRAGLVAPLPLMPATGMEYTRRRLRGHSTDAALRAARHAAWQPRFGAERDAPAVVTLWGARAEFEVLLAEPPHADERWFPDETTRFGALARRLWEPIISARGAGR